MEREASTGRDELLSEPEVQYVLERATQIEAGKASLSVAELRRVALEAGFGAEAVRRALDEVLDARRRGAAVAPLRGPAIGATRETAAAPGRDAWARIGRYVGAWAQRWLRPAALLTGAAMLGATAKLAGTDGMLLLAYILFCGGTISLVRRHRRERAQEAYQRELASLWLGATIPWLLFDSFDTDEVVGGHLLVWLGAAVVGGLIVKGLSVRLRHRSGPREEEPDAAPIAHGT